MGNDHDSWVQQALGVVGLGTQQAESGAPASGQSSAPTISSVSNGDGSFTITGSGFVANATVTVRLVDDALHTFWLATASDGQGKMSVTTASIARGRKSIFLRDRRPAEQERT